MIGDIKMEQEKIILTKSGKAKLEKELRELIDVVRPEVIEELKAARAQGDLSENADYDAARKKQAEIEARIREIEEILSNCEVIESSTGSTKLVDFGHEVVILDLDTEEEETYKIVNTIEVVKVDDNKISVESPLAKAIIGHQIGAIVTVDGPIKYSVKIIEIK
jgi:transcription elongation factor GreA